MLDLMTHLFRLQAIVEEGSLHRAAERLNITQPALTRSLALLEKRFGRTILERSAQGVRPNAYGDRVLTWARRLARLWELAEADLQVGHSDKHLTFRVSAGPLWRAVILPQVIAELQRSFPGLTIDLQNAQYGNTISDLLEGRIDIFFGGLQAVGAPSKRLVTRCFTTVHDRVVARESHPVFARLGPDGKLPPERLLDYPWMTYTDDPVYETTTLHASVERLGLSPEISIRCESLISAMGLLQNSDCLSILPDAALTKTSMPRIIPVPVDLGRRKIDSGALYRDEMQDWSPLKHLLALCEAMFLDS
jgi:DNA-binding transcriptional LysR family regulator